MAIELERPMLSHEEFRALQDPPDEEDVRGYEYDNGRLIPVPPVNGPQSRAWVDLSSRLHRHVGQGALGEIWIDMAVYLDPQGRRRVFPEIVYLAAGQLHQYDPESEAIVGPPTLVVEVTAAASQVRDRKTKMSAYHEARVPWYWIADVLSRQTEEYQWSREGYRLVSRIAFEGELRPQLFPELVITGIR
jgi:Uma2 family endonuclease